MLGCPPRMMKEGDGFGEALWMLEIAFRVGKGSRSEQLLRHVAVIDCPAVQELHQVWLAIYLPALGFSSSDISMLKC